jgi:hypothetical protein
MRYYTLAAAVVAAIFFGGQAMADNVHVGNTTNNTTTNNKGGTGIGIGVAKSNSKSSAKASASVSNTSVNVNTAKGGNAHQSQKQGQAQSAKTGDQSVSVGGDNVSYEAAASSAYAPSINPSASCQVPVTLGGQALIGGGSFGTTYTSDDCVQREDTRLYCAFAERGQADGAMCRALADDLPTVRKYKERMAQAKADGTPVAYRSAPASSPSSLYAND